MRSDVPIAVVGMACRFPGARDSAAFWDNIARDACAIAPMPPHRFNRARYYDPEIGAYGKTYCELGGLIEEHPFDARGIHLPPKVLEATDVAHLWALEVARATFDDAGFEPDAAARLRTGVIVGHARGSMMSADLAFATATEGMLDALDRAPSIAALGPEAIARLKERVVARVHDRYGRRNEDGGIGSMASGLTGLISNVLGLGGRHMVIDAACASSFAALDLAVRGLRAGKMELALAGGASYSQELSVIMFAQSRALSPDGSFPFDRRANGFISSDGIGFVLLERLEDAIRNRHRVRAVIRGVGGACDGKGRALWAPRKEGQVLAIRRAYASCGVDPASVSLIEAHATSTPVGDRTEVEAVHEVFGARGTPMPIGSVKGNIGHCREAAGAAALTKAILALEHATLPPTGGFREPSPEIPWGSVAVEVITAPRPWAAGDGPRRAGVDAFGIGGLDYHVIVEEAPPPRRVFASAGLEAPVPVAAAAPCDIAIVGMGVRFPGAAGVPALWDQLSAGRDVLADVPASRWKKEIYHRPGDRAPYRTYAKRGGFLSDFRADWRRYQVPPKLIERNDPLQFMLLESAIDALEDAGIELGAIDRTRVAVLIGSVFGSDYALELSLAIRALELTEDVMAELGGARGLVPEAEVLAALRAPLPSINEDSSGSFSSSTLASRTAKTLDLMGPAAAIDAACASSIASLEAACEMLRAGEIDLAVYGGGDRAMRVQRYEAYCQFYALSRSDRARPFDVDADGFLPGEGAAVCVLERLEDARARGHHVYAVVKGIGSRADGERKGLHRPSARALADAMSIALAESRVAPERVGFVECHGAGTPVGDATELEAIRSAYGLANGAADRRAHALVLGSVKGNVGHAQGAAGAISVVKTALAIDRGELPPTAGFERAHPAHGFGSAIYVSREKERFPGAGELRAAGVSSMGIAGINYHAILASVPRTVSRANGASEERSMAKLEIFEGGEAKALRDEPGFDAFWSRTQPEIASLVEELWTARRNGAAAEPAPAVPAVAVPAPAVPAVAAPAVAVPAPAVALPSREDVREFIVAALVRETGYPPELIEVHADLEADLGIDTVKQAQVLGKVRDHFDIRTDEKLSLRDFPTIGHVLDYVEQQLRTKTPRTARATKLPMLDLTEKRSAAAPQPARTPAPPVSVSAPTRIEVPPAPRPAPVPVAPPSTPAQARAPSHHEERTPALVSVASEPRTPAAVSTPVAILHLHGTAQELGEQHGEALRDQIREVIDRYEAFLGVHGQELLALPAAIPHVVSFFDPSSIEELEGIARAAGVPFKHLLAYNLDAALFPAYVAGCTQAVRLGWINDGTMIHLVNEDSPLLLHLDGLCPRTVQIRRRTDGRHPHRRTVHFSVAGQSAGPNALADNGLTVTSTTLLDGTAPAGIPDGAPHPQLVKRIVEDADSVADAIAIARAFPRAGRWSLLVSDGDRDEAAYLEYDGAVILREEYITRAMVTTNHAISGAAGGCAAPEHSLHRHARAKAAIDEARPLTVERAKQILRDREDLGRRRTVAHPTMNTVRRVDNVMSLVVEPARRRFHVTDRVVVGGGGEHDPTQFLALGYGASTIATRSQLHPHNAASTLPLPHPEPADSTPPAEAEPRR